MIEIEYCKPENATLTANVETIDGAITHLKSGVSLEDNETIRIIETDTRAVIAFIRGTKGLAILAAGLSGVVIDNASQNDVSKEAMHFKDQEIADLNQALIEANATVSDVNLALQTALKRCVDLESQIDPESEANKDQIIQSQANELASLRRPRK